MIEVITTWVRKLYFERYQHYITDAAGDEVETRELQGAFRVEMQNSDEWRLDYFNTYESLDDPLGLAAGVIVHPGQYRFGQWRTDYTLGQQRSVSGRIRFGSGEFYDGHWTEVSFGSGRVRLSPTFEFEPGFSFNWIDLPGQEVLSRLVSTRVSFTPNTRLLIGGLVQYNSGTGSLSSSARLRFEYTAGSDLFFVYSDGRSALPNGSWRQTNHSLAFKITRLFRL